MEQAKEHVNIKAKSRLARRMKEKKMFSVDSFL